MKPRIAVIHPLLVAGGGSEACALETIRALQEDYRVTLITMGRPDLAALCAKYRAEIDLARLETELLPIPAGTARRFDAFRGVGLSRHCRRRARSFDIMISAYNVMDFGAPGIQMIADFSFDDRLRRELDLAGGVAAGAFKKASPWRSIYLELARALAGDREEGWKRNLTLANSHWAGRLLRDRFGLSSRVVYPPVAGESPRVPWAEREDGFVVIGRLVPEKGLPLIMDILSEVRKVKPVHLHIIGRRGRTSYARKIEDLCRRHADWVRLEGEMYGPEKEAFLARHKYGLSGCRSEAFGIAVAEMVKAGLVVWVPDGGGQTEIVADASLIFDGPDDAVTRILSVITGAERETSLRRHLEGRAAAFSAERFGAEMRAVVRDFLTDSHSHGA